MLDGRTGVQALAVISFPVRPEMLDRFDAWDLGLALQQIGRSIAADATLIGTTIIVPFQERCAMKVSLDLNGKHKMWDFAMTYHELPPEYAAEIGAACRSFASYITHTAGAATGNDPAYSVRFKYDADKSAGLSGDLDHGDASQRQLLYSQAVAIQDAGVELLKKLMASAKMEIASGERK